jgi:CRISPR/Cas system-associated protein Cas10 (large subunit of type III CRISPR-Cas system)
LSRLRWKLSKLWQIPYSDNYWNHIHDLQWRVYAEHIRLDNKEDNDRLRDFIEYAMAFIEYETVKRVQDAREEEELFKDSNNEDVFLDQLKQMGINLDKETLYKAREQTDRTNPEEDIIRVVEKDK